MSRTLAATFLPRRSIFSRRPLAILWRVAAAWDRGCSPRLASDSEAYTLSAILAEFNGPGTIMLPASTFTQTLLANTGGNTAASQVTQGDLTGTVTYHYNPVPEPSTLALFGVGAVSLLACAWRRRRVA